MTVWVGEAVGGDAEPMAPVPCSCSAGGAGRCLHSSAAEPGEKRRRKARRRGRREREIIWGVWEGRLGGEVGRVQLDMRTFV